MRKLAVVIGRFQVPELHEGHLYFLREASRRADKLLVLIGCSTKTDIMNLLDYTLRRSMIKEAFPDAYTIVLYDCPNNDIKWSKEIDSLLLPHRDKYEMTLYGSRDSFISHYSGKIPYVNIPCLGEHSGTEIRNNLKPINNKDFRAGVMWGLMNYLK